MTIKNLKQFQARMKKRIDNADKKMARDRNTLVGYVKAHASDGSGGNYALHLEFGTRTMGARPFMQPALQKNERKIKEIFMQEGIIDK